MERLPQASLGFLLLSFICFVTPGTSPPVTRGQYSMKCRYSCRPSEVERALKGVEDTGRTAAERVQRWRVSEPPALSTYCHSSPFSSLQASQLPSLHHMLYGTAVSDIEKQTDTNTTGCARGR